MRWSKTRIIKLFKWEANTVNSAATSKTAKASKKIEPKSTVALINGIRWVYCRIDSCLAIICQLHSLDCPQVFSELIMFGLFQQTLLVQRNDIKKPLGIYHRSGILFQLNCIVVHGRNYISDWRRDEKGETKDALTHPKSKAPYLYDENDSARESMLKKK